MNHSPRRKKTGFWTLVFCLIFTVGVGIAFANRQSTSNGANSKTAQPTDPTSPTSTAPAPPPSSGNTAASDTAMKSGGGPSAQEIAAAKASGKVWVNTESGVYHKSGRWYGKTKSGKFMTEADAKAAGYKPAH
jgi:hypothetical protein